jgi:class 3 adenylate cyclase
MMNTIEPMTSASSPSGPGLGTVGIRPVDVDRLLDLPRDPEYLEGLEDALGSFTGSRQLAGPGMAELIGAVAAAVAAAILAGEGRAQLAAAAGYPAYSAPAQPAFSPDGQICAMLAVDIAGFTRPDRDDDIRGYLHEELYGFLRKALDDSGIPWAECYREDRGDGALVVVPPGISPKGIIDPFPERLRALVRFHNHVSRPTAGIQLRAAVHIGMAVHDGNGFVGSDVNYLFRMLDARALRRALAASDGELAMAVSGYVFRNLVCRYPSLVSPDAFEEIRFQVKRTRARAWTYLPRVGRQQ